MALVGLLAFVLIAGSFLTGLSNNYYQNLTPPEPTINAGSGALATIAKVDTLLMGEEDERKKEFADFAKEGFQAPIMPINQAIQAISDSQTFPKDHKSQAIANIASNKNTLTEITLWDDVAEDGDVVSISTAGIRQEIPIMHEPTKVLLPLVAGQPIMLTGVKDGGGGITVAIGNGNIPLANPVMKEGETLSIPVR